MTVHPPVLRYQIRYRDGGEPETVISNDMADAMTRRLSAQKRWVRLSPCGAMVGGSPTSIQPRRSSR